MNPNGLLDLTTEQHGVAQILLTHGNQERLI